MFYAKSETQQTIVEHTAELQIRYEQLKAEYGHLIPNETVWKLLKIAVDYHDVGKAYGHFQMKIRKAMRLPADLHKGPNIPHNYLSPFFVPLQKFNLSPDERKIVIQAITYHHEKKVEFDPHLVEEIYESELFPLFPLVSEHMNMEMNDTYDGIHKLFRYMDWNNRIDSMKSQNIYLLYILVKGLLHRLDHAASAGVPIESQTHVNLASLTELYLKSKFGNGGNPPRDLQIFAKQNQDRNLIIIAQTGMGKTEAALLWAGSKKTFFTLPLRVSLNALYERISQQIGFKEAGLLHSSSASYLIDHAREDWETIRDQSKHLSTKLLFTTVDQILKFPLKFKGYEKYYATMAYSAVVIDEIQAYDPNIAAVILKALEMIHRIGGRFMIMTATLPQLYLDHLELRDGQDYLHRTFVNEQQRHRISIVNLPIESQIDQLIESGKKKKVLVIVNTVKKAVSLYHSLIERSKETLNDHFAENYVKLLHSMFIQKHRSMLEQDIKHFNDNRGANGIWITTQLVEASIDIDFDELHTEAATLDSLFQRFGRCYRKRELESATPNIWIYTENVSGKGYIYDSYLLEQSLSLLNEFDGRVILEEFKVEMVRRLYSREMLEGTSYWDAFKLALKRIDSIIEYDKTEQMAQEMLRDIQSVQVIPRSIYDDHLHLFEQLENEKDPLERQRLRREIEKLTVSIRGGYLKKDPGMVSPHNHKAKRKDGSVYVILPHVWILNAEYDFSEKEISGSGVLLDSTLSNFI